MNKLRQGRWLQVFSDLCSAKSSVAAAALAAMLLPGVAAFGATSSRAHRPLPTPLHVSRVMDSGTHPSKKRKGGLKSQTDASEGKHGAASRGSGKRGGKGRGRRTEPVDDVVPMYRAEREGRNGRGSLQAMHSPDRRHGRYSNQPAPLVTSFRHGHGTAAPKPYGRSLSEYAESHPTPALHASRAGVTRSTAPETNVHPTMARDAATGGYFVAQPRAYAEGVSQPDDDDRMPRAHAGTAIDAGSVPGAGVVASVSAAPAHATPTPVHQPAVVQGFGAEVAVPSSGASSSSSPDRPGGTHRRNHPSTWNPEPTAALSAEPLEERDAITEAAVSPNVLPELYDRSGHLVMRAPLKGSHDVLVHQNLMADSDGLERAQNDADLERLRAAHLLVTLPASESLVVNADLPANRRVARPWTVMFAADIGRAFYAHFHEPIFVTSAVRTVQYQAHLQMVNGNAAGLWGDTASPHLTGQAVDLAKRGMSNAQLAWMRGYLLPLMQSGKIDVEEEFHQACFHVSVYRSYAAGRRLPQHDVAQVHAVAGQDEEAPAPAAPDEK